MLVTQDNCVGKRWYVVLISFESSLVGVDRTEMWMKWITAVVMTLWRLLCTVVTLMSRLFCTLLCWVLLVFIYGRWRPRPSAVTSRLRSSQTFPTVHTHTKHYCSFRQYGLNFYQHKIKRDGCIVWNAHSTVLGEEALLIYIVPVCCVKTGRYGKT